MSSCFGRNWRSRRHRLMKMKIPGFLRSKRKDMEPKQEITMPALTEDLVFEILSRLPLKSFCRFKCVCKSWLAFSSDPRHRQKLPITPAGLFYQRCEYRDAIHLARFPSSDREIDATLSFVPSYDHLRLMDCTNGLLLCCYEGFSSFFPDISRSVVCNPATQEWNFLPPTQPASDHTHHLVLCFDPSWSEHFYVFRFWKRKFSDPEVHPINEVQVFSSQDFTWHSSLLKSEVGFHGRSHFKNGMLYVEHSWDHCVLAMEIDATDTYTHLLKGTIIQLPGFAVKPELIRHSVGCVSHSSGVLCFAQQEMDGRMMRIWNLEGSSPERWVLKYQLNMMDAFWRDVLIRTDHEGFLRFDYSIMAFDLEREIVILGEEGTWKFLSFSISTRKLSQLQTPTTCELSEKFYYVPYYCKHSGFSTLRGLR